MHGCRCEAVGLGIAYPTVLLDIRYALARVGVETPEPHTPHIPLRDLRFQKFIRNQQRLHGFACVTAACGYCLIGSSLQLLRVRFWIGRWALGHRLLFIFTESSGCSHYVLVESSGPKSDVRVPPNFEKFLP
jgi:hypothetical protein